MIKNNKVLIVTIIFFAFIMLTSTMVMATNPIDDPDHYKPGGISGDDAKLITEKTNKVLSVIAVTGIIISVITSVVLGIKYMVGSISEKAEYKKSMIPYIIGIVFIVAASTVVGLIATMTQDAIQ